jgi:gliding motility-associated-like protein
LISGSFQAQGGEQYLTLGNFDTDDNTDTLNVNPWQIPDLHNYAVYVFDAVFLYDCSEHVQAYAGEDASICGNETAKLGTTQIVGCHYKWTPSTGLDNDTLANPIAKPTQTTTYCLTMTDPYYQITTDTVVMTVTDDCKEVFFIPNIFSPNGDGQNEVFRIRGENISNATLQIYNRWGNIVFESQDVTQGWDGTFNGKDCEEDVYYFKAEIIFKDGRVENKKGNITLMR